MCCTTTAESLLTDSGCSCYIFLLQEFSRGKFRPCCPLCNPACDWAVSLKLFSENIVPPMHTARKSPCSCNIMVIKYRSLNAVRFFVEYLIIIKDKSIPNVFMQNMHRALSPYWKASFKASYLKFVGFAAGFMITHWVENTTIDNSWKNFSHNDPFDKLKKTWAHSLVLVSFFPRLHFDSSSLKESHTYVLCNISLWVQVSTDNSTFPPHELQFYPQHVHCCAATKVMSWKPVR